MTQGGSFWDTVDQTASPIKDAFTKFGDEQNDLIVQQVVRQSITRAIEAAGEQRTSSKHEGGARLKDNDR